MNTDIGFQINTARRLADDVARIGALTRHRLSGRESEADNDQSRDRGEQQRQSPQIGTWPPSASNALSDTSLNVTVANEVVRDDLGKSVAVVSISEVSDPTSQRIVYRRLSRICSTSASVSSTTYWTKHLLVKPKLKLKTWTNSLPKCEQSGEAWRRW